MYAVIKNQIDMKIFFPLLLLLYFSATYSQDSCVVKLSLNDCSNCYGGMCLIDNSPNYSKKVLIVKENDKGITDYFITKHLKLKNNYTYIYSDSLYNSMSSSPMSEVFIYNSNELIYNGSLNNLSFKDVLSEIHMDTLYSMPDSVVLSNFILLNEIRDYYVITDMIFGKIYVINPEAEKKIDIISADFVNLTQLQTDFGSDSLSLAIYQKLLPHIEPTKNDNIKIQEPVEFRGNLLIPVYVPCPVYDTFERTLSLPSKPAFIHWGLDESKILGIYSTEETIIDYHGIKYSILANCFPIDQSSLIVKCQSVDSLRPILLGRLDFNDNAMSVSLNFNYTIPDYYIQTGLRTNMLGLTIRFPFVFTKLSPYVYNLETEGEVVFPYQNEPFNFHLNTIMDQKFSFRLVDAIHSELGFEILYMDAKDQFILDSYDSDLNLISTKIVFKEISGSLLNVRFIRENSLLILTKDAHLIRYTLL